jgi:hypothetical protein
MHTVQFDVETEQRLSALAAKGGKQPDALIKEAVLDTWKTWRTITRLKRLPNVSKQAKNLPYPSKRSCEILAWTIEIAEPPDPCAGLPAFPFTHGKPSMEVVCRINPSMRARVGMS